MFPRDPLHDQIGPYRIVRRLASRRGADLYLGIHDGPMGFQRECVLKLVPSPDGSAEPGTAEELAHEAKICSRLNHPAIVRMFDFFEHGDKLVLVFEHFAGVSLARLLSHFRRRRQRVPDAAVWFLAHRLFSALAHAHAVVDDKGTPTPVIHRDVQPGHVVMSQDAHVRLAGFGIAKIAGSSGNTAVGFIKGTPAYMAPEQALGEKINQRVDVYAAGLVVWEMLSSRSVRPPHDFAQGAGLLKLIAGRRFDPISTLRRDIPREIAAAVDACLEQSANKRTIQCSEMERWLEKVVDIDAGRRELRERLVQLRASNARAVAPPRMSVAARASQPPNPKRAVPSRFPGVATRVTGRPSERVEGDAPRSSRRVPPLLASSFPPPPLPNVQDVPSAKSVPSKGTSRTMFGVAPPPAGLPRDNQARPPTSSSYDALPPPPLDGGQEDDVSAFVAKLKKPPGVRSIRAHAVDMERDVTELRPMDFGPDVRPWPPPEVAVAVRENHESGREDTTVLTSRSRLFHTLRKQRILLAIAASSVVALVMVAVGVWFVVRSFLGSASSGAASSVAGPVAPSLSVISAPPSRTAVAELLTDAGLEARSEAAPAAVTEPAAPPPIDIPDYQGAFLMKAPPEGTVYVSGVPLGETGEWILLTCNKHYFMRVGTKPGPRGLRGTWWLSPGQSVMIRCRQRMEVQATPRYAPPEPTHGMKK